MKIIGFKNNDTGQASGIWPQRFKHLDSNLINRLMKFNM